INHWRHRYGAGLRYIMSRKGLLTIGAGYAGAFLRTRPEVATPDVQIHFLIFSADAAGAVLHAFPGFMASVCQLRPETRGFVRIKSSDPSVPPAIQPRYLSARSDCDTVVAGLKTMRRIMNEPAMRRYIARARARRSLRQRRRSPRLRARHRHHGVSPDLDLPHGPRPLSRRRRALARAWFRAPARDRCLDHADGGIRQYQCGGGDDRRKRRRHGV